MLRSARRLLGKRIGAIIVEFALVVPFLFLLMLPVAYFANVLFAVYIPMLIPLVIRILKRRIRKHHEKIHAEK